MYGKVFSSMFRGSLHGQWEAIVTFTAMIALAEREGEVDMTAEALAATTSIPLDIILKGIASLEASDPNSRTPDHDGRRILRVSETRAWGWVITNYAHYRDFRSAEERREYFKDQKRKQRATGDVHQCPPESTAVHQSPPRQRSLSSVSTNVDVDVDVDVGSKEEEGLASAAASWGLPQEYLSDFEALRRSVRSPESLDREMQTLLAGRHPSVEGCSPEDVGRGLRELILSGRPPNGLSSWVRTAKKQRLTAPASSNSTGEAVGDEFTELAKRYAAEEAKNK